MGDAAHARLSERSSGTCEDETYSCERGLGLSWLEVGPVWCVRVHAARGANELVDGVIDATHAGRVCTRQTQAPPRQAERLFENCMR